MSASNTDKFKKLSRRWVGQIGSGGVTDGVVTTIPLASATNLPTDTGVIVVIDRVDSNGTATPALEESTVGVVSGTNLISCVRGIEGTAQAHNAGAVVEILVTAKGYNDIIDGILVEHNQLGGHKDITASSVSVNSSVTACNLVASSVVSNSVTSRTTNQDLSLSSNGSGKLKRVSMVSDTIYDNGNSGSAISINWANGSTQKLTLTASTTLSYSNVSAGDYLSLWVVQGGSGSYSMAYPATTLQTGSAITALSTAVGSNDWRGIRAVASGTYHVVANSNALG